jgi:hypothetical protein
VFFYADTYVVRNIIEHGYLTTDSVSSDTRVFWGKAFTRETLPILPLLISVIKVVTNINISTIYTAFPSFIITSFAFILIFRRLRVNTFAVILLGVAAGTATPGTSLYTMAPNGSGRGILYTAVVLLVLFLYSIKSKDSKNTTVLALPIIVCMCVLFQWYPPHYAKLLGIVGVVTVALSYKRLQQMAALLSIIIIGGQLFVWIFTIPLGPYVHYFTLAVSGLSELQISSPLSGGTDVGTNEALKSTAIPHKYYSLLPLILLFPSGVYGGLHAIIKITRDRSKLHPIELVAVSWGITVLVISVFYLATSTGWLIGRPYLLALPVIFLGAGIGLKQRRKSTQIVISLLILLLVLVSLSFQAGSAASEIQTYQPGVAEGSQWAGAYASGNIYGDVKTGAPMASSGEFSARYPREFQGLDRGFYSENYTRFCKHMRPYHGMILNSQMHRTGFYAAALPRKPMNTSAYEMRNKNSMKVYSNNESRYIIPSCG